MTQRHFFVYCC